MQMRAATEEQVERNMRAVAGVLRNRLGITDASTSERFSHRTADYLGELNALHPFREGNGGSQREFIGDVAEANGYSIAWENVSQSKTLAAAIEFFRGDSKLAQLIREHLDTACAADLVKYERIERQDIFKNGVEGRWSYRLPAVKSWLERLKEELDAADLWGELIAGKALAIRSALTPQTAWFTEEQVRAPGTAIAVRCKRAGKNSLNKRSRPRASRRLADHCMRRLPVILIACAILVPAAYSQQNDNPPDTSSKRIFWIIPNFRTTAELKNYKPIGVADKFKIARLDTFDRGTVALAAIFAADSQLTNSDKSFGQGVEGYAHYFGTSYADFAIGNYMTEGIFPAFLHQDPRYFRRGHGSSWTRFAYSAGQIFFTHGDSGHTQINFSEIGGNASAVAVSMAYYPDQRNVSDAISALGTQLAVDMASNILKEFEPDITRKFSRKHRHTDAAVQ